MKMKLILMKLMNEIYVLLKQVPENLNNAKIIQPSCN